MYARACAARQLTRIVHQLVGWDKGTAIWWAGACELTFHFDWMVCWVRWPFPPAHHGLTHTDPTRRESSGLTVTDGTHHPTDARPRLPPAPFPGREITVRSHPSPEAR